MKYTTGKVVPVSYTITGTPDSEYYVSSHMPSVSSVVLTGDSAAISDISSINLGDISVQGAKGNFTKTVNINELLPPGVSAAGTETVTVTVNVEQYAVKELGISTDKLRKVGENGDYNYSYSFNSSGISVKGTEAVLNRLEESSLSYSLDVSGKTPGTYEMEIRFSLPDGVQLQNKYTCVVKIASNYTATPSNSPTETPAAPTPTAAPLEPTALPEPTEESDQQ